MMPAMKEVHTTCCHWKILNIGQALPVEDVEASVQSQEQHVVCSDILDVFESIYHEKLRQDGHCLQPYAKRPQEVYGVEGLMRDDCSQ